MNKKLIVRIAEGLGNQFFMYANAYSLSKKLNYDLYLDNTSGYFKKKNMIRNYELDKFNIPQNIIGQNLKFDTYVKDFKRKILKKTNFFNIKKNFLIESRDKKKISSYVDYSNENYSDILFVEGHFESQKFFITYSDEIKNRFTINNKYLENNNKYIDLLKNNNSVSICIRQNRFSEGQLINNEKSRIFTLNTINYIKKSVNFIKNRISNPKFFIWSNDFSGLREHFDEDTFVYILNNNNKSLNDFNLFKYSKHFIVGPTSFHWWGAWLNNNPNKICLRPLNINPSDNRDFWPESWIAI
tara:strand:- start:1307 stop:2203 length:897 start_codon:yes stop_codon:yes gene_type:complete